MTDRSLQTHRAITAGAEYERLKDAVAAEAAYRQALVLDPQSVEALAGLGRSALRSGDDEAARHLLGRAIALVDPQISPELHRAMGLACRRLGRLSEAEAHYRRLLSAPSGGSSDDRLNLGNVVLAGRRPEEALTLYETASVLSPEDGRGPYHIGLALAALNRDAAAIAAYRRALDLTPTFWPAVANLAALLTAHGQLDAAEAVLQASRLRAGAPGYLLSRLAAVLSGKGAFASALEVCRQALERDPADAAALVVQGMVLQSEGALPAAALSFRQALALEPASVEAMFNLANVLKDLGEGSEAIALYDRALQERPNLAPARIARCMAELAPLYDSQDALVRARVAYEAALRRLEADRTGPAAIPLADGVGASQPFYLAYQGRDDRVLQDVYGRIIAAAMAERYPPPRSLPQPIRSGRIAVGVVSGYFRRHANWTVPIKGWLTQLDRRKFRLLGYHTGGLQDAATAQAQSLCDRFIQGPLSLDAWRSAIAADAPDILLFPEIGMDPVSVRLAALRLARVQCTSWGHPQTSGLPTIDYFLSSDLMEPEDAQAHYTETLVRLPNLSVYCEPLAAPERSLSRREFGLPDDGCLFWCGQSLQKFLPSDDDVFARIAMAAPDSRFIFIDFAGSQAMTDRFQGRLDRAFARRGLKAATRCHFLPRLDTERYSAALGLSDVFLDSLGWSGCNSTLEALAFNLPIVTLPGPMMRSRHGAAMMTMMRLGDAIAKDVDDYVATAARLALSREARRDASERIHRNKRRLYGDRACIEGLERFLWAVGHGDAPTIRSKVPALSSPQ